MASNPAGEASLYMELAPGSLARVDLTVETFKDEMQLAMASYDRHVVCLEKLPDECDATLRSLVEKAIRAFETRGPNLRHGIALDRHITVILSQTDGPRPLCGIYWNLHSPYARKQESAAQPSRTGRQGT